MSSQLTLKNVICYVVDNKDIPLEGSAILEAQQYKQ